MGESVTKVTLNDFLSGLLAALAIKGQEVLSLRQGRADRALAMVFEEFHKSAIDENLDVQFRIRLHPFHRDSISMRKAIFKAAQRDLISFDNPEFQDIRLKLTKDEANKVLSGLPINREHFLEIAERFLESYEAVAM